MTRESAATRTPEPGDEPAQARAVPGGHLVRAADQLLMALLVTAMAGAWMWSGWKVAQQNLPDYGPAVTFYAHELEALRQREHARAFRDPGRASRQAVWITVNAAHLLDTTQALNPATPATLALRDRLRAEWKRLRAAEELSRFGSLTIPEPAGAKLRGMVSDLDRTIQTYSVHPPPGYDPAYAWPLIVSMHGHGWFARYQGHPAPAYAGAVCLAPQGRGATDYMEQGEIDVLEAIDEVCEDFHIDPDRIYLTGVSMGGTGSWHLGAHYPDRFAAIQPIAGNADYRSWTYRWGWNTPFEGRFDRLRHWLQERNTPRAYAGNLRRLPAYCIHGTADTIVPPEHARNMVAALREQGAAVEYREFPQCGHGGFPGATIQDGLAWMCGQVRDPFPETVSLRAAHLRRGKAYWIRMERWDKPCAFAGIEASAVDPNHVEVTTENLRGFAILHTPERFDTRLPLFVSVDEQRVIFPKHDGTARWLALRRDGRGQWRDAARVPEPELVKRPGLEGPISEVLLAPFVVVYGTTAGEARVARLWAAEARHFAAEWTRRNNSPCPVLADHELTPGILARRHLLLFGGPEHNAVSARLAARLPLERVARTGATASEEGAGHGLFTLYPNPEAPDRLVVVWSAVGAEGIYQAWFRFGNWFNWGVLDSRKYFDFAVYDAASASPETLLSLGWFGWDWTLEAGQVYTGVPAVRSRYAPQGFPRLETVPEDATELKLVELMPAGLDQMRGAIGIGRSFFGHPLPVPDSIGVRAPTYIDYDIGGRFEQFSGEVALVNDPESAQCSWRMGQEVVAFTVRADDSRVLAEIRDISWAKPRAAFAVDVSGVRRLRLETVVVSGPDWLHGGAAWLGPALGPRPPPVEP